MFDISNSSHHMKSIAIHKNRKWKLIEIKYGPIRKSHKTMGDGWVLINMLQDVTVKVEKKELTSY